MRKIIFVKLVLMNLHILITVWIMKTVLSAYILNVPLYVIMYLMIITMMVALFLWRFLLWRFLNVGGINLILKAQKPTLFVSYLIKSLLLSTFVKNPSILFLVFKMLITLIMIVFQDWKLNVRQTNDEYWLNFYNVKFII